MNCLIAGASGLIGQELVREVIKDSRFSSATVVARAHLKESHPKVKTVITSFDKLEAQTLPQTEVAFCTLGTTIKKAGSKAAFFKVDHDYVIQFAKACFKSGVKTFVVVTALGASANSRVFYNKVKGQAEVDLKSLHFDHLVILRPSLLIGDRAERRPVERLAQTLSPLLSAIMVGPLAKSRPVMASQVARRMVAATFDVSCGQRGAKIILNHEI